MTQARTSLTIALVLLTHAALGAGQQPSPTPAARLDGRAVHTPANVRAFDDVARARLAALLSASRLAREMIGGIADGEAMVTLRSNARLLRTERAGGLTQFAVVDGVLVAQIEFDTGDRPVVRQLAVLAHELAHTFEMLTLPRPSTRALAGRLMAGLGRLTPWSPHLRLETPFARAVEQDVLRELMEGRPAEVSRLAHLARQHRLARVRPRHGEAATGAPASRARDDRRTPVSAAGEIPPVP